MLRQIRDSNTKKTSLSVNKHDSFVAPIAKGVHLIDVTMDLSKTTTLSKSGLLLCLLHFQNSYINHYPMLQHTLVIEIQDNKWLKWDSKELKPINIDRLNYVIVRKKDVLQLRVGGAGHALLALNAKKIQQIFKDILDNTKDSATARKKVLSMFEEINKDYMAVWREKHIVAAGELHFINGELSEINLDSGAFHFENITHEQNESIHSVLKSFSIFENVKIHTTYQGASLPSPVPPVMSLTMTESEEKVYTETVVTEKKAALQSAEKKLPTIFTLFMKSPVLKPKPTHNSPPSENPQAKAA